MRTDGSDGPRPINDGEPAGRSTTPDVHFCIGDQVYRMRAGQAGQTIDRWDAHLRGWIPRDLPVRVPQDEGPPELWPGDGGGSHSSPFACHERPDGNKSVLYTSVWPRDGVPLVAAGSDGCFYDPPEMRGQPGPLGPLLAYGRRLIAADLQAPRLWASADPLTGDWQMLSDPSWHTRGHARVSHLTQFEGQLQVFLDNPSTGFEVWRSENGGAQWSPVLEYGAYRFRRNAVVTAVAQVGRHTYVGAGSTGPDPFSSGRPVGFEVLVFDDAGEWAVLSGDCRCTPEGLRAPLLACGPGFDRSDDYRVIGLAGVADTLFVLTQRRRLWRLAGGEVERLSIEEDMTPAAILVDQGIPWLVLGDDEPVALRRLR